MPTANKLTAAQRAAIRAACRDGWESNADLARRYGVTPATIQYYRTQTEGAEPPHSRDVDMSHEDRELLYMNTRMAAAVKAVQAPLSPLPTAAEWEESFRVANEKSAPSGPPPDLVQSWADAFRHADFPDTGPAINIVPATTAPVGMQEDPWDLETPPDRVEWRAWSAARERCEGCDQAVPIRDLWILRHRAWAVVLCPSCRAALGVRVG